MSVIAIVPIKHHSGRIPGKNRRLFNGIPLYQIILETLQQVPEIKLVVVNTDCAIVREGVSENFPQIVLYDRPEYLRGDKVSTNELIYDTISSLELGTDIFLQTHVTNPLLRAETISQAIHKFHESKNDSLFTAIKHYTRLFDKDGVAMNHDMNNLIPTQDLDPIYEENSCLYLFRKDSFMERKNRVGKNPIIFEMNKIESQDIDWEDDFVLAEILQKVEQQKLSTKKKKVVVVTGSSGGIGLRICQVFSEGGWNVIGVDREEGSNSYCIVNIVGDITNLFVIAEVIDAIKKLGGELHCLVNNAAYQICKEFINTNEKEFDSVMNVNLKAPFMISRALLPYLRGEKGCIVNISSVHSIATSSGIAAYSISKAALSGLTRTLAVELAREGIRVNGVIPGAIDTPMLYQHLSVEEIKKMMEKHPLQRIGTPREIGHMVFYLADNKKAGFITGQNIVVDGGATILLSTEV